MRMVSAFPMGLFEREWSHNDDAEILVYPRVVSVRERLLEGVAVNLSRFSSMPDTEREIQSLRQYQEGDDLRRINWKATARRGQPITKVYQIERTQQIYVIIDGSRLSLRDSDPHGSRSANLEESEVDDYTTIMERYAAAALVMGLAADRQADEFGLLTFDDRIRKFVRAKSGKAHYDVCRDALHTLQPKSVTPDFAELFTFIATKIRRRALLIFLTNLDDPVLAESFTFNIDLISRKHII